MQFLYPAVLWALSLLAIPIVIHLFKLRRYKTVFFSDLRFLKAIQKQTKNRSQLKHLLVLASRLFALAALILAFAQPFFPGTNSKQSAVAPVYIYLDNSPSMEAATASGELLNNGKLKIRDIIATYGENHNYKWLSNSQMTPSRSWLNGAQLRDETNALKVSAAFVTFADLINAIALDAQNYEGEKRVFVISDFQKSFMDAATIEPDSSLLIYPVHLAENTNFANISIDSIWFSSPVFSVGFEQQLFAQITNHSTEVINDLSVRLELNEATKGTQLVTLPPNSQTTIDLSFTPNTQGSVKGVLSIIDSPIIFDNELYFVMDVQATRLAYHIYDTSPTPLLQKILDDELVTYLSAKSTTVDLEKLQQADLVILDGLQALPSGLATTIASQVQAGQNLFWIPNENPDCEAYQAFSAMLGVGDFANAKEDSLSVLSFRYDDPYLTGVFQGPSDKVRLPSVFKWQPIQKKQGKLQHDLMTLSNGEPLVLRTQNGGQILQLAGKLDQSWNTLSHHPLLLPIVYQGVLFRFAQNPNYLLSGSQQPWTVNLSNESGDGAVHIQDAKNSVIPAQTRRGNKVSLFLDNGPFQAGHYILTQNSATIGSLAVNIPPEESRTEYWNEQALSENLAEKGFTVFPLSLNGTQDLSIQLKELETGRVLWQYFLIFALFFFLVEALLLRFWK